MKYFMLYMIPLVSVVYCDDVEDVKVVNLNQWPEYVLTSTEWTDLITKLYVNESESVKYLFSECLKFPAGIRNKYTKLLNDYKVAVSYLFKQLKEMKNINDLENGTAEETDDNASLVKYNKIRSLGFKAINSYFNSLKHKLMLQSQLKFGDAEHLGDKILTSFAKRSLDHDYYADGFKSFTTGIIILPVIITSYIYLF